METLGQRVRRIRTARNLTQAELAVAAEMERTDIIAVEKERLSLGPTRLARVADALHVTVLELAPEAEPDEKGLLLEDRLEAIEAAQDRRMKMFEEFVEATTLRLLALEEAQEKQARRSAQRQRKTR